MGADAAEKRRWTPKEYLEMERTSVDKHEYFDGEIFLMAGASPEHNLIVAGLVSALRGALPGKCLVFPSDQRLFIPATGLYTYADASVVCGAPDFNEDNPRALQNPHAIFEVLSEATESYDRGKKFAQYRTIPALKDYVLIAQDQLVVEHYRLQLGGGWLLREVRQGAVVLDCGELLVESIYQQRLAR
jgi:Uma2 family endonuclease